MNRTLTLCCLYLLSPLTFAISNIENERPNLPEEGISGSLSIGLNGKTGNQKERSNEGGAKIIYRTNNEIFITLIEYEYGTKQNLKISDNSFIHTRWVHLLNNNWAAEVFAQREENELDNLTSRALAGGGGRYLIAQEKDVYSLAVGLGSLYEIEKQNLVSYQETNKLWRANVYYTYKHQLNDSVNVVNTTYLQPSLHDTEDYRVLFDTGLNVKLTNSLRLTLNYRLSYDSEPAKNLAVIPVIDNHKINTEYKTGLSYKF